MKKIVIMGAGGRDFHNFNVVYRDDSDTEVVAFTATQIPGIDERTYPAALAGIRYADGIAIRPEEELDGIIARHEVDEVVLAYSDLAHEDVMHKASRVLAAGANFVLLGPNATMLESTKPVIAVCAARTGSGKSQTSRRIGQLLLDEGLSVALVRHPMPYGDLEAMRVQRFATLEDIDASNPTIEEREEYEAPVALGMVMYAGVDYAQILAQAQEEADVLIWDGGNNDLPFFRPDLHITVVDPLRPGHELRYHPGETNVRMADVVIVNKADTADPRDVAKVVTNVRKVNPRATIVQAASPLTIENGSALEDARVLVVEDGPTVTHGEMPYGAGTIAAQRAGARALVDPRPFAVGSIAETFKQYPGIGNVLPAMGYGEAQLAELQTTINATDCDVVVTGTPIDLGRLIDIRHPVRHVTYEYGDHGRPTLAEVLTPLVQRVRGKLVAV
ncbi:MAG: cyclic 2,3-diphosphoglycerate synthase [Gaiellaceae bacterium]